jgi:hypothetical protein
MADNSCTPAALRQSAFYFSSPTSTPTHNTPLQPLQLPAARVADTHTHSFGSIAAAGIVHEPWEGVSPKAQALAATLMAAQKQRVNARRTKTLPPALQGLDRRDRDVPPLLISSLGLRAGAG